METSASVAQRKPRQVFIAYPYEFDRTENYRSVFKALAEECKIEFAFADEQITSVHILEKIRSMIESSQFGIYDISGWNSNVTLELGLALGLGEKAYIAINPTYKPDVLDTPADLRGIDRIEYVSMEQLKSNLSDLLKRQLPPSIHFQYPDFLWNPRGEPRIASPERHAIALREINVLLEHDMYEPNVVHVTLSCQIISQGWKSIDYNHAPWVHIDFLDHRGKVIKVRGAREWEHIEFYFNQENPFKKERKLRIDHLSDVADIRVWLGAGYAEKSTPERWRPRMVMTKIHALLGRLRRAVEHAFNGVLGKG